MKSLIYKNFATSKSMLLVFTAIFIVSAILKIFQAETYHSISLSLPFSVDIYMIYAVIVIVRNISDSDKSSWEDYSRALPCKAYQRVGARYLFCLILFVVVFVAFASASAITRLWGQRVSLERMFSSWSENELPIYLIYLLIFIFSTAFVLPISYAMKRSGVRSLIMGAMYFPPFAALVSLVIFDALGGYNGLTESVLTLKFSGIFAAVAVSAYAASFCFSVIAETKTEKEKLKPVKAFAAVLTAVAVAFSGVAVGWLYERGALIKNAEWEDNGDFSDSFDATEPAPSVSYNFEEIEKNKKEVNNALARTLMTDVVDKLCGVTLVDKRYEEATAFFEQAGYEGYIHEGSRNEVLDILIVEKVTEKDNFTVVISAEVMPTVIVYPDSPETFDDADKKYAEIMELFHVGTEEKEAVEHMKRLGLCPYEISEVSRSDTPMRTYRFEIRYYSEYKKAMKSTVKLEFDVINGRITNVES